MADQPGSNEGDEIQDDTVTAQPASFGQHRERGKKFIDTLPANTQMFSEDEKGNVQFLEPRVVCATGDRLLSNAARFALSATQFCCQKGIGKVYVFSPHLQDLFKNHAFRHLSVFYAVPEMFYVPESWSEAGQKEWQGMEMIHQMEHLFARHGWVDAEFPVLPLTVEIRKEQRKKPEFAAPPEAGVMVYFSPYAHVGSTSDFRAIAKEEKRISGRGADVGSRFKCQKGWKVFDEKFKVQGMKGVMEKIHELYHDLNQDLLVPYKSLRTHYIQIEQEAAKAQPKKGGS